MYAWCNYLHCMVVALQLASLHDYSIVLAFLCGLIDLTADFVRPITAVQRSGSLSCYRLCRQGMNGPCGTPCTRVPNPELHFIFDWSK